MKLVLAFYVFANIDFWGVTPARAQPGPCPPPVSHISISEGSLSPMPGVTFYLRHFAATLSPLGKEDPACYQKLTNVTHAEIFVSNESLTRVFAQKLEGSGSKVKGLKVENGEGKVTLSGRITKIVPVQFSITGPVSTDGKTLSMDAQTIKANGIPVKALLDLLGEPLGSVLGFKGMKGITVEGNKLSFSPEEIAHLKGYIASVETTAQGLTLRYGRVPGRTRSGAAMP